MKRLSINLLRKSLDYFGYNFSLIKKIKSKNQLSLKKDKLTKHILNADLKFKYSFHDFENYRQIDAKKNKNFDFEILSEYLFKGSLGNILPVGIYLNSMKSKLSNQKKLVYFNNSRQPYTNSTIVRYFKKYINFIDVNYHQDYHINENLYPVLGYYIPMRSQSPNIYFGMNLVNSKKKTKPLFKLTKIDKKKGYEILRKFGLKNIKWFCVLHVRTSGYRGEKKGVEEFRNSNIDNYYESIKEVVKNGGVVFRMGDKSMPKCIKIKGLIDYCHSNLKSDFMDVFLAAESKFAIVTSSGFWPIAKFFGTPILMTNCWGLSLYPCFDDEDVYLPRIPYKKNNKKKKKISFKKLLSTDFLIRNYQYSKFLKKNNIYFDENSQEEIKKATQLIIDSKINNIKTKLSPHQKKLNNFFQNNTRKYVLKEKMKANCIIPDYILENYF